MEPHISAALLALGVITFSKERMIKVVKKKTEEEKVNILSLDWKSYVKYIKLLTCEVGGKTPLKNQITSSYKKSPYTSNETILRK